MNHVIYFVRHGETEGNKQDIHQPLEMPLSEVGIAQIEMVAQSLLPLHPQRIYTNDYKYRLQHTAEILADALQVQVEVTEHLKDQSKPTLLRGLSKDDPQVQEVKKLQRLHAGDKDWHYADEENLHDRIQHVQQFLELVESRDETPVVATITSTFIRTVRYVIEHGTTLDAEAYERYEKEVPASNAAVFVIGQKDGGDWEILEWNKTYP